MTPVSRLLGVFAAVIVTLPTYYKLVGAQVVSPTPWKKPVFAMAYSSTDSHLIIQGGLTAFSIQPDARSSEFFRLDLGVNWTADNSMWTNLKTTSTSLPIAGFTGALLPNGGMAVRGYGLTEGFGAIAGFIDTQAAFTSVPITAQPVNFPSTTGYVITSSPAGDVYFISEGRIRSTTSSIIRTFNGQIETIAAVWCPLLGTGGAVLTTKVSGSTASFSWLNGENWETLSTTQEPVPAVYGHCLVKGGTDGLYYLFGGSPQTSPGASSGQLYVLDVRSRSLTKLGKATGKRAFMACAATKESFFAWGGMNDRGQPADTTPLIFNFAVGDWVNRNIIPPPPPPPPPPPAINPNPDNPGAGNGNGTNPGPGGNNNGNGNGGNGNGNGGNGNGGSGKGNDNNGNGGAGNGNNDDSGSGSSQLNIAAIAGGAGGGIALIALVALFFFVGRKRRESSKYDDRMFSSKRSSLQDDYSSRGRRDSRSSDGGNEHSIHCPEPFSAIHSKREPPSNPPRKKRSSSSLRSESDQKYLQLEPLRCNSRSDLALDSPKAKEYMGSTWNSGFENPNVTRSNTPTTDSHDPSIGWNRRWDRGNLQPRDSPTEKTLHLAPDSQQDHGSSRPPSTRKYPDRQQKYPSPQQIDRQNAIPPETRTPRSGSPLSVGFQNTGFTQPNHTQNHPRPREPQYRALPRGDPQYGDPLPLDPNYSNSRSGEPQFGLALSHNHPHSTPVLNASRGLDPHGTPVLNASRGLDPHGTPVLYASQGLDPHGTPALNASRGLDPHGTPLFNTSQGLDPHGTPVLNASRNSSPSPREPRGKANRKKDPHRRTPQPFIPQHSAVQQGEPQFGNS